MFNFLSGIGQIGQHLFGGNPGKNLEQGFNQGMGYLDPYMRGGADAFGRYGSESQGLTGMRGPLQDQIMRMMQNPGGLMKAIGEGYQQSPGFQFNVDQATKAMNSASQAGGMVGTPAHQQNIATTVSGLANQDYNNYMNQALGTMNQGLGAGQNMYGMGMQGLGNMSQMGAGAAGQGANMAMQNAQQKYIADMNRQRGLWSGIGNVVGGIGSMFMPGMGMGGGMSGMSQLSGRLPGR